MTDDQEEGGIFLSGHTNIAKNDLIQDVLRWTDSSESWFTSGLITAPTCSVNYGTAGIAYALYRIATIKNDSRLLSLADLWSMRAKSNMGYEGAFYSTKLDLTPKTVGHISPYHTASGVFAVRALISKAMGDITSLQESVNGFISASNAPCEKLDLTLGKSSTLIASSLLLDTIKDSNLHVRSSLMQLGNQTMNDIWDQINCLQHISKEEKVSFLGIAHGWAGLLYTTMRWCQTSGQRMPDQMEDRLRQLAEFAEPTGRGVHWLRKHNIKRNRSDDYMSGWCNGSTGFVYLWTRAHKMLGDDAYLELAEKAAWNTLEEPSTISNLCCGIAGQAYALLNLYKYTNQTVWLHRAEEMANRAAIGIRSTSFSKASLYKGEVGVAVLVADMSNPDLSSMPFFEQEGW
ncbi:lanthionine synthetase LanC family protein [Neobacillus ginsengisoli]|uniref:Lantibiotic modifying enzyme n=1 Tax=Neobacillus ginsengisoli TaxID=904295 RepID=A0ABT9Y2I0_9BACI|nr:lanthionine synthetase LanC family protein [Neobacillus ginsengisoli]MDQ0201956.1 lantibiotic modifying enzyme [Neobacillus ginsengisoli]